MGILFDLQVSQSASFGSCHVAGGSLPSYSITPTFVVTPVSFANQSVGDRYRQEFGPNGQIVSIDAAGSSLSILLADGQTISIRSTSSMVFQGISDFSALTSDELVDADATFQSDGSLSASRMAVHDTDTNNLSVAIGPIVGTNSFGPSAWVLAPQHQGTLTNNHEAADPMPYAP
jgi:hypothetical protein